MHDTQGWTPEGECVYIRQTTSAYIISDIYHLVHSNKIIQTLRQLLSFIYYSVGCGFQLQVLVIMFVS